MVDKKPGKPQLWLAETKFHPPLQRADVIPRENLIEDLHAFLASQPLTLLSAPAGYGKSTLFAALPLAHPDLRFAWLSLDEGDNDPVRFMTAFIVALQHLNPACGSAALSLLTSQTHLEGGIQRVTGVLINEILENLSDPFVQVLDDLHRISEPAIYAALDYLLERLPPNMHLGVATRIDPPLSLARLRARGELAEMRMSTLRFSEEESKTFFNKNLHLGLSSDELALLQSRTEGWPVGLRLFASYLDPEITSDDRLQFIHLLSKTDHDIFEFLAEEVFNRQEAEIRQFLMETAILPELTPELCQAVTRCEDAGAMLEELYHRNLFLVQVSPSQRQVNSEIQATLIDQPQLELKHLKYGRRYRYHDLFADFLRHRLGQERQNRIPNLHQRAAQAEKDPARAVDHFLAATQWNEAAEIIEQIGAEMFNRGYLDTLSRWINRLPPSVRESQPLLLQYLSNCALWKGNWKEAQVLLERAFIAFEEADDDAGKGEVLVNLAICTVGRGDVAKGGELFGQALEYPISLHSRIQALLGRALAEGAFGNVELAERDFKKAMDLVRPANELDPLYLELLPFFHPDFVVISGGLENLEHIAHQAKKQVDDEVSLTRLMVDELITILNLFRGRLDEAIRIGEGALVLRKRLGGHPFGSLNAARFLMIAYAARGNFAAVEPLFDVLYLGVDQTEQPPPDLVIYMFYAGRVRWLQGRLGEAREIYDRMCALIEKDPTLDSPEDRICCAWMLSLLEMSDKHFGEAERILRQPEVYSQSDRSSNVNGNTHLMLARLYWQQNREQEALAELRPALDYYEQLGISFPFLLEGQSIVPLIRLAIEKGICASYTHSLLEVLDADDSPLPINVPFTGATLTSREVEILRLVVSGYSNRGIAKDLIISEWTVKSHLTKIYRKLDVTSRTKAIARARELGLALPSNHL